jgi:hypothetical protein
LERLAPIENDGAGHMTTWLRSALVAVTALAMNAAPGFANILIAVDKGTQRMAVSVDGVPKYQFVVSTGRAGFGTPSGTYHPERLERSWFSKEYYNSPMPYSIFFHGGFAIHGSYEISRLGGPASHGCIRLHPSNAEKLFALVRSEGMDATTIVVSGSSPASARRSVPVAARPAAPPEPTYNQPYYNYGNPYYGNPYAWPQQQRPTYGNPY